MKTTQMNSEREKAKSLNSLVATLLALTNEYPVLTRRFAPRLGLRPRLASLPPTPVAAEPSEDNFLNGPNTYWHVNKPKPSSNPYNTEAEWPNGGRCDLGMGLVLGVLGLAVDARMKRLARMCEFAALDILDHSYHTSDCLSAVRSCVEAERKGLPQRLLEEKAVSGMPDRNVWRSARLIVMNMDQSLQASFVKLLMKNISDKVTPLLPDHSISNNEKQA